MPTSSEPAPRVEDTDVIVLREVVKSYRLGWFGGDLRNDVRALFGRLLGRGDQDPVERARVQALDGVDLRIRRGENVGIIGPNGAGKTTMLKLVANITRPNRGELWVRGRVAALIQLGAGFHPELSGRENVFLYGAILGLSHAELTARYDEIVAFAELESFMDTPVKRYSNGMYVRLGFAIAVHVDADILLIDEVLAVGDQAFREKCLKRMRNYMEGDTTMLFVSHDRELVESVCDRAILLDGGQVLADGPVTEVLDTYGERALTRGRLDLDGREHDPERPAVALTQVLVCDGNRRVETEFAEGHAMSVRIGFVAWEDTAALAFGVRIQRGMTLVYETRSSATADLRAVRAGQRGTAELSLAALPLLNGSYTVSAWLEVGDQDRYTVRCDGAERALSFRVRSEESRGGGLVSLGPSWKIDLEHEDAAP